MKKLKPFYRYELTFSKDIPAYLLSGELDLVEDIQKIVDGKNGNFSKANAVMNIYKCLEKDFPFDEYDYGQDTYFSTALNIWNNYQERIKKYMHKKFEKGLLGPKDHPYHTKEEAFLEQVLRGFSPFPDSTVLKTYHLKSTIIPLVWGNFKDMDEARKFQERMGIKGYTGIHQPI